MAQDNDGLVKRMDGAGGEKVLPAGRSRIRDAAVPVAIRDGIAVLTPDAVAREVGVRWMVRVRERLLAQGSNGMGPMALWPAIHGPLLWGHPGTQLP